MNLYCKCSKEIKRIKLGELREDYKPYKGLAKEYILVCPEASSQEPIKKSHTFIYLHALATNPDYPLDKEL